MPDVSGSNPAFWANNYMYYAMRYQGSSVVDAKNYFQQMEIAKKALKENAVKNPNWEKSIIDNQGYPLDSGGDRYPDYISPVESGGISKIMLIFFSILGLGLILK